MPFPDSNLHYPINKFICLILIALLFTLTACGGGGSAATTDTVPGGAAPQEPFINGLNTSDDNIEFGKNEDNTTLTAIFINGTGTIDNGVGPVMNNIPVTVSPKVTTTYTLTVTNSVGRSVSLSREIKVTNAAGNIIYPAPNIDSFVASQETITEGETTNLTAIFSNNNGQAFIDHGVGPVVSGSPKTVAPTITTTYTLTITTPDGKNPHTATFTVTVKPLPPVIVSFTALPSTIPAGGSAKLTAIFSRGTGTIDNGVGPVVTGISNTVHPTSTTTYMLTVSNAGGVATETITLTVEPVSSAGSMTSKRKEHSATLLANGLIFVAGGNEDGTTALGSSERYDPATGLFTPTAPMKAARYNHAATLLANGKVLITGGMDAGSPIASAELYDPITDTYTPITDTNIPGSSLTTPRSSHTATLLANDKVFITGGRDTAGSPLTSTEIYDPITGTFTASVNLPAARYEHTATLLSNSTVLITGGRGANDALASVLIYDPVSSTFFNTGSLKTARFSHTATLLANGKVIITGGSNDGISPLSSTERYDPDTGIFTIINPDPVSIERMSHTVTLLANGMALVAGGYDNTGTLSSAVVFNTLDAGPGVFTLSSKSMQFTRADHTATRLQSGKILIVGGVKIGDQNTTGQNIAEIYDPVTDTFTRTDTLDYLNNHYDGRSSHTATLLVNGKVLIAGGKNTGWWDWVSHPSIKSAELYDPNVSYDPDNHPDSGSFTSIRDMNSARQYHTATRLPNGKVLITGGINNMPSAELYDPLDNSFTTITGAGAMTSPRLHHTATLLPNGKVFITGGITNNDSTNPGEVLSSAELYDPETNVFTPIDTPNRWPHYNHTAILLPDGNVLITGGSPDTSDIPVNFSEIYDSSSNTFHNTIGNMHIARWRSTNTLLPNGKVLIVSGGTGGGTSVPTASAELYDPSNGTFTYTDNVKIARFAHTASLLPNGKVLISGGITCGADRCGLATRSLLEAELYQ